MPKKSTTCDGCHYSREHLLIPGKLECHVRSIEKWPIRNPTSWCGDWRDPTIKYLPNYQPRVRGLVRYLNQLLTWPK